MLENCLLTLCSTRSEASLEDGGKELWRLQVGGVGGTYVQWGWGEKQWGVRKRDEPRRENEKDIAIDHQIWDSLAPYMYHGDSVAWSSLVAVNLYIDFELT